MNERWNRDIEIGIDKSKRVSKDMDYALVES